jgi:signal transduction histidine kinase
LNWLPRLVARIPATVHTKLLAAFLVIVALLITLGVVGLQVLGHANRRAGDLVKRQERIAAYRQFQRDTSLPPSWPWNERTLEATLRQLEQFRHELDHLPFIAPDDTGPLAMIGHDYDRFVTVVGQVIELFAAGHVAEARTLQLTQASPLADRLERLTNDLVNNAEVALVASMEASQVAYRRSRWVVVAFSVGSIGLALMLGYAISWSLIGPVTSMDARLSLIAAGDLSQRAEVPNRDELGALATQFNRMAAQLETRTAELTRSVEELQALGEVGQALSSTLDLETVLSTIVSRANQLAGTDSCTVYEYDARAQEFQLRATHNLDEEVVAIARRAPIRRGEGATGRTAVTLEPVQIPDIAQERAYQSHLRDALVKTGNRALLAIPLLRERHLVGGLAVTKKTPGEFSARVIDLLKTFAAQSAVAIQNARLFREIEDKSRQLEAASRHKSEFLANMSHELRTPLNAILGFNEMILGQIYGEVPPDLLVPLTDVQNSGKHLLRLINNVLDLAKIEAGRMELTATDYAVQDIVERVRASLQPLAVDKGLELVSSVPAEMPLARGDDGRIAQCLMNLAGNALKFTRRGRVEIGVELHDDVLVYRVADTGIGIAPEKIESVFAEFRQGDATIASEFGGTGLGLSITKKFVEMHGGRIWVESELGKGSTFFFSIPLRLAEGRSP